MDIEKYIPDEFDKCQSCRGKTDLVGLQIGHTRLVLCGLCSHSLVQLLLNRYYPVWGDGPIHDLMEHI